MWRNHKQWMPSPDSHCSFFFFFNAPIFDQFLDSALKANHMKKILNYRAAVKLSGPDQGDGGFFLQQAVLFHDNTLKPH